MEGDTVSWLDATFIGHGHCYLWRTDLLLLHAASDSLIFLAYFSIPVALWNLMRRRPDLEYGWMFSLFAMFIFACGTTHLLSVWNIWNGDYYLSGSIKLLTAIVSVLTAILIWPLIPKVIALPKPSELAASNASLRSEIELRQTTEAKLRESREDLERRVIERTRELSNAKEALEKEVEFRRQTEKRFRSLFESSPNGILLVAPGGAIQLANAKTLSLFGYSRDELTDKPIENVIPEFRSAPELASSLEAPETFDGGQDSMAARKNGERIPIELRLSSVGDPGDRSTIVTVTDISERKWLEERQKLQTTALKRSNEELEQFAFVASHDLREPLRKLLSFSQLLLSGRYGDFNERGREFVGYMRDAAQRMEALLDSLLNYSRVTSKGRPFESVDLNEVVRDVETDLEMSLEDSNGSITISPLPAVLGDKVQLHQLFQNLISNSLKYRKTNEPPQIRIYSQEGETGYVDVYVEDKGIGFDMQYRGQIFDVFKRLHGRTEYDGTGMGLAICRKIVERHNGVIDVESEEGVGTTFRISLKVA